MLYLSCKYNIFFFVVRMCIMKKSLKVNYIYNLFYQILIMVLPLLVTPYLSRVLGAEKIGIYSYTMSIVSYFILFGCIGINLYGQRLVAAVQENKEKRSKIFYELFLLKSITILISLIFYGIFLSCFICIKIYRTGHCICPGSCCRAFPYNMYFSVF